MTLFLALTGSIGMGKSTTAQMFREAGIPVHDSDATVHALYRGIAAPMIESAFPGTTTDGEVDRGELSKHVVGNEAAMKRLEAIVHPLVRQAEKEFREQAIAANSPLAVLDIPLLFETGRQDTVDGVIVVTAPAGVQHQRVLARQGMTEEKFLSILKRQVPDELKRKQATFLIDTSNGLEEARTRVQDIIEQVLRKPPPTISASGSQKA